MLGKSPADLKLGVYGSTGRMGKQVLEVSQQWSPSFKSIEPIRRFSEFQGQADVIVDFSLPQAQGDLISYCERSKCALVSGTTGLSNSHMDDFKALAEKVSVLWAPNMSMGVMVLNRMLREFKNLAQWEFELSETHHVHKKDKPSGTALAIQKNLEGILGHSIPPVQAFRQGEVIGDHKVKAHSPFEEISIEHRATDRRVFAQGAIKAAIWLVGQGPGLYTLEDLAITA
ncbi:MAG TPA: 4-hydroxy-tetrahydrodipicolinate reductase [Bdellovibrionales bacterium]|nr:4-hydroxy-tetrahydrodipicolinate reductase [Pseudobdellovibrionaceae bacterium]HAG92047.1 4-hydroxy-tetrahydrodipicolinate reductase [Bdellovibrionales bacterium]|tara:strand:- start:262 stop:948 length:687 start_codon:yes stop_codon:yes gene_type:complete